MVVERQGAGHSIAGSNTWHANTATGARLLILVVVASEGGWEEQTTATPNNSAFILPVGTGERLETPCGMCTSRHVVTSRLTAAKTSYCALTMAFFSDAPGTRRSRGKAAGSG